MTQINQHTRVREHQDNKVYIHSLLHHCHHPHISPERLCKYFNLLKFYIFQSYLPRGRALLILNLGSGWCGWLTLPPGFFTPGKDVRYLLNSRLDRPQCRSERLRRWVSLTATGIRTPNRPSRTA